MGGAGRGVAPSTGQGAILRRFCAAMGKIPKNPNPRTDPWEHVFWTGAGVAFANWNSEWEAKLRKEVDALNAERQANDARFMESIVKGESK